MRCLLPVTAFVFAVWVLLSSIGLSQDAEPRPDGDPPFTLKIPVNEVSLTFHVSDTRGLPVDNLSKDTFELLDNGRPQKEILSFESYRDLPIRAGFLIDTSGSMLKELDRNQYIANLYVSHLVRRGIDRVFVIGFDTKPRVLQDWTDSAEAIASSLHSIAEGTNSGTAIFDSLYKTCRDRWTTDRGATTGNFILLFTDGIDDASHARIDDVIDMCQQARTSIYVFSDQWNLRGTSRGQKTLEELTTKSGGRIFLRLDEKEIEKDVRIMDSDQRNQYRLVYRPSHLKQDGAFHRIGLRCSLRGSTILTRSGYYPAGRP